MPSAAHSRWHFPLKELGKDVRAWNEEGMLEKYSFLAGRANFSLCLPSSDPEEEFDVVVALDTATIQSAGHNFQCDQGRAKLWINIDHHPSNPRYGDLVHIDPIAPATGEFV